MIGQGMHFLNGLDFMDCQTFNFRILQILMVSMTLYWSITIFILHVFVSCIQNKFFVRFLYKIILILMYISRGYKGAVWFRHSLSLYAMKKSSLYNVNHYYLRAYVFWALKWEYIKTTTVFLLLLELARTPPPACLYLPYSEVEVHSKREKGGSHYGIVSWWGGGG